MWSWYNSMIFIWFPSRPSPNYQAEIITEGLIAQVSPSLSIQVRQSTLFPPFYLTAYGIPAKVQNLILDSPVRYVKIWNIYLIPFECLASQHILPLFGSKNRSTASCLKHIISVKTGIYYPNNVPNIGGQFWNNTFEIDLNTHAGIIT